MLSCRLWCNRIRVEAANGPHCPAEQRFHELHRSTFIYDALKSQKTPSPIPAIVDALTEPLGLGVNVDTKL